MDVFQKQQVIIQNFGLNSLKVLNYVLPVAQQVPGLNPKVVPALDSLSTNIADNTGNGNPYSGKLGDDSNTTDSSDTNKYNGNVGHVNSNPPDYPMVISSVLGTPVFDNLVIAAGSYVDTTYGTVKYDQMNFDACLITLHQQNNVILTSIQGRDGEIIEYISKMSFRINVKGGIFGDPKKFTGVQNRRPFADIHNLQKMLNSNAALKVLPNGNTSGGFLSEWNISQFVILDKSIPQTEGGYNYQLFEFSAVQDTPVALAQLQTVSAAQPAQPAAPAQSAAPAQ